jgi:choline dehydrogenase-like flavoprotein
MLSWYAIHEGTARMGNDPKDSVLNKWNQMKVSNVFVTDGSIPSIACQNLL